jgi:hypothetical protein
LFDIDPEMFKMTVDTAGKNPPVQSPQRAPGGKRMARIPPGWVRVCVPWFTTAERPCPFGQRERLFLLLLHMSRFGARPVNLTSAATEGIGLSRKERWRYLQQFEADGWVRVERDGLKSATVHMLNLTN